jgi:Rrf2 family transcriptional regulator, iron-sulfur cluster assembly transcription factor
MILNKTTEYALTVLGHMAVSDEEIFSAEFLHDKLEIPRRYLRTLLTDLSKLGLIKSAKGRNGGFIFAKPLEEISLSYVIESVEGTTVMGSCILGHTKCNEDQPCVMHETWMEARSSMINTLSNTTLRDLKERKLAKDSRF